MSVSVPVPASMIEVGDMHFFGFGGGLADPNLERLRTLVRRAVAAVSQ